MVVVHGTKKFLDRVGGPVPAPEDGSTTALGSWYATVIFWRPQAALFVNERTLLPVFVGFAPAATLVNRFAAEAARVLAGHGVDPSFVGRELGEMGEHRLAKTTNRSVVGIMNEFSFLAGRHRETRGTHDLFELSMRLADTPCGPLYGRNRSPHRELAAVVGADPG